MKQLFLLLLLFLAQGAHCAVLEEITSANITSGDYVLASDATRTGLDRDKIKVDVNFRYRSNSGGVESTNYRFNVQIRDAANGNVVESFLMAPFTVNAGTIFTNDFRALEFSPTQTLVPWKNYLLRIELRENLIGVTYTPQDTLDTASQQFLHFQSTNDNDAEVNVLGEVASVDWVRRWALQTATSANQQEFKASVDLTLHRYDNYLAASPGSDFLSFQVTYELREQGTNALIAIANDTSTAVDNLAEFSLNGSSQEPETTTLTKEFTFKPNSQLDSASTKYFLRVSLSHEEVVGSGTFIDDQQNKSSTNEPLHHFNGTLVGESDGNTVNLIMDSLANDDNEVQDTLDGDHLITIIDSPTGSIEGYPNFTFASTREYFVHLFDDGRAEFTSTTFPIDIEIPIQGLIGTVNQIRFTRSDMYFDAAGVHADIGLIFPSGLGFHTVQSGSTKTRVYESTLDSGVRLMTDDLEPTATNILFTLGSGQKYTLVEESKPIEISSATILWEVDNGVIKPGGAITVQYLRDFEEQVLDASPLPAADKVYLSNENYYKHVAGVTAQIPTPKIELSTLGTAELSIELDFDPGTFQTHFPYNAGVTWADPSVLCVENDLPLPANSALENPGHLALPYARDCASAAALGCGTIGYATSKLNPTQDLAFTLDGGLSVGGNIIQQSSRRDLVMGYIDVLSSPTVTYAHDTTVFSKGRFLMAGHFISGTEHGLDLKNGPGRILSSGFTASNTAIDERPGTAEYLTGLADYPGVNYRVADETSTVSATSTIGGTKSPNYNLANRAKYYTRLSGVSGIHEPTSNPFTAPVTIYGYKFNFTSFGFSFLSSEVHDSITAGSMFVPAPSNFTLAFDPIYLSCLGALTTAEIDGGTLSDTLEYWQAPFVANAAQFEPPAGGECDPSEAYLTLGVTANASNFSTLLAGKLGFQPDGNLTTLKDSDDGTGPANVDSRLSLVSSATIEGPEDEQYHFSPIANAYFDNYDLAENQTDDVGQLNFLGHLDVAFFESPVVHLQTGAKPANDTDLIHMMGGWTDGGGLRAEDNPTFDSDNRGRPSTETLTSYRATTDSDHQVHAIQSWLGVVDFDYALQWSSSTRSFSSIQPKTNDLMVLTTENELVYLSAENAEIDFGASLDLGIPEINLSSLAINAIEESTGVLEALTQSLTDELTDVLLDGLDSGEALLNDRLDELFDELFAATIEPTIDDFYDALDAAGTDPVAFQTAIDNYTDTTGPLYNDLRNMVGNAGTNGSLANSVDDSLARLQAAIRAVIGQVELDASGNVVLSNPTLTVPEDAVVTTGTTFVEGIFARTDDDGDGNPDELGYEIAKVLVIALLEELAPDIAGNLSAVLDAAAGALLSEVEDELNAALAEVAPSLETLKGTLMDIHNTIGELRSNLTIFEELEDIYAASTAEILDMLDSVALVADDFINGLDFEEYSREEVKELLHSTLRDQFNGSDLIADVRVTLANYLYDLNDSLNEAISSGFSQLNRMLTELVEDVLPIDSGLQGMLDSLASVGAAGKIDGYAHINGDALRTLRLDAEIELQLPDEFNVGGYFEIKQLDSLGDDVCNYAGEGNFAAEVRMGAVDIPVRFLGGEPRFDIEGKFTFDTANGFALRGMGGSFEMTGGELEFEAMKITSLGAAAMFGSDENYMAAKVGLEFDSYALAGGVFFGRTCSLEPLELVDPDVANVLGDPPFTGIYAYGEAQIPIVNVSCLFSLNAKAGVGVFVFAEGPTVGGKMLVGASGRALCAVEVGGELTLIGAKVGNDFNFSGKGRVFGKVGICPLCTEFNKSVTLTYKNDKWDYDY